MRQQGRVVLQHLLCKGPREPLFWSHISRSFVSARAATSARCFTSTGSSHADIPAAAPAAREVMRYDVLIVGAGPAGLSAAIRLKQVETCSPFHTNLLICTHQHSKHMLHVEHTHNIARESLLPAMAYLQHSNLGVVFMHMI